MTYFFGNKTQIGDSLDRVESRQKVTGSARYAAEYNLPGVTFGVLVTSTIAKGRIRHLDTKAAEAAPGVLAIVSHLNAPKVPGFQDPVDNEGSRVHGQEFRLFHDERIYHNFQPVALAIADTFERATYAASLVKVEYEQEQHQTNIHQNKGKAIKPARGNDYARGKADTYKTAAVKIEQEYQTPIQVHVPMEMHAATAVWEGATKLTVYNKTQATKISQQEICKAFQLKPEDVEVHSPFVGGAFGSSSRVWPQEMAAILGSKVVGRPVKVMLKRDQVFNMVGYRPKSLQKVGLGATADGTLTGITHEAISFTSTYEQFTERLIDPTKSLYRCPNLNTLYRLVPLDYSTPCWTRGPGETSGSFALESAMDELAYALNMDPLALRLKNFAEKDPFNDKPWSSNFLRECYQLGAERFGWSKRNPKPGAMQKNGMLVGMGMAAGIYKSERSKADARATLQPDGKVLVQSAVADVGPGSATIFTQIAADTLGVDASQIQFEWGNSTLPDAPGQFGSHTTASVGSAVYDVCVALKQKVADMAVSQKGTTLYQAAAHDLVWEADAISLKGSEKKVLYTDLLKNQQLQAVQVNVESKGGEEQEKHSGKSFCANFVEVEVHPVTGQVRVSRVVSVVDAGTIINHKTAESQVYGSVVWGIGIALMEDAIVDHRYGRHLNNDLADYRVPVNADIPNIDVIFINKKDTVIDPMGAKGIGEIPLVGFTAAVANAVFHATGKRIRELPIVPDKLV
ncbi:xanthine dehydrogenase family protein molybdopterin-binding subunit [Pontibacter qinzhouensis]|uniref:Xanthine dehydrogenase family protein molybdopterin-binding subunit n=1 Tax=Pontibacter qinzhouensis TaxID=2603253 RepID=A0A5C8KCB4_9BACT|nr:xanthine dehydrogenase family protein molybdopterin-binding subunit [Pontibacter qinzhouensis]TXK49121.1 xanthine dehydrogenase family protein molybdopterin-binding subunit [Pontibacter qinzhouensis]